MAHCVQCKQEISGSDSFCRHCGAQQSYPNPSGIRVKNGSRSINIGIGNLPQASIHVAHIGDFYSKQISEHIPHLKRINTKTTPVKAVWLNFIGFIGFFGSIASIVGYLRQYGFFNLSAPGFPLWLAFLAFVSVIISMLGFSLRKGMNISFDHQVLHTDSKGRILISSVSGDCPVPSCSGVLYLQSMGQENERATKLVCTRYPERHKFDFYPSELQ
jgi:hypothetical protein